MSASPCEPFDAEEASLKRAYDALPHGEPPAALDARILAHARAAVAPRAKRPRPWFLGAGLGTAAAAVFAAGIAWQLGVFEGDRALSTAPAETPAAQEEELDRIDIEFLKQERKKDEATLPEQVTPGAPPPPPPAAAPAPAASPVVLQDAGSGPDTLERRRESADRPRQQAQPEPFPAAAEEVQAAPAYADGDTRADRDLHRDEGERAGARSNVLAEPQATATDSANAAPADANVEATESAPAAAVSAPPPLGATATGGAGSRRAAGLAKETALPPWAEDARLAPDAWIERIRDRVRQGDRQGAEHSLRRFVLEHPRQRVPRDLQRLLVE